MKITMYELLGKVYKGEELPKLDVNDFAYYFYDKLGETCTLKDLRNVLNDTVEILEEEKKIPEKINTFEELTRIPENFHFNDILLADKINEIIDYFKSKGE